MQEYAKKFNVQTKAHKKWLAGLSVGDKILITSGVHPDLAGVSYVATITHCRKTVVKSGHTAYSRVTGLRTKDTGQYISKPSKAAIAEDDLYTAAGKLTEDVERFLDRIQCVQDDAADLTPAILREMKKGLRSLAK